MTELYDKDYVCPYCESSFTSKHVKTSAVRVKERKKDLQVTYVGQSPLYYEVICCKYCGFTQFETDFAKKLSSTDRQNLTQTIYENWQSQDFTGERNVYDAIKVYLIALLNYKSITTSYLTLARLHLRLLWFYREIENYEGEKYLESALYYYKIGYETEKVSLDAELDLLYIIGELTRQIGEYAEAVKWFSKVVSHPKISTNIQLKNLAREQWQLASEQFRT